MLNRRGEKRPVSYPMFQSIRDRQSVFESIAAWNAPILMTQWDGEIERVQGLLVSGTFYSTLGVAPVLGRLISAEDDAPGSRSGAVAVISHQYWKRRFSQSPTVLGKTVRIEGVQFTIIGVMPPSFFGLEVGKISDVVIPLTAQELIAPAGPKISNVNVLWINTIARLKTGIAPVQAKAEIETIWPQALETLMPGDFSPARRASFLRNRVQVASAERGISDIRERFSKPLFLLLLLGTLVMIVACVNIGLLTLARTIERHQEIALRLSIGGSRIRIAMQMITESALLCLISAAAAFGISYWSAGAVIRMASGPGVPIELDLQPTLSVFLFSLGLALCAALISGLLSAYRITKTDLATVLKENTRTVGKSRLAVVLNRSLVAGQFALTVMLMIGAGLFVRSILNLVNLDLGFDRKHVLLVDLVPRPGGYNGISLPAYYSDLLAKASSLPKATSATISILTPMQNADPSTTVAVDGYIPAPNEDMSVYESYVGPGYLQTFGLKLRAGRDFTFHDSTDAPPVAIVSATFAKRFFGAGDPLGKLVTVSQPRPGQQMQIIAVVNDSQFRSVKERAPALLYRAVFQNPRMLGNMTLSVRSNGSDRDVAEAVKTQVVALGREMPVHVRPLEQQIDESLSQDRLLAVIASAFGIIGMIVGCLGLYGLTTYTTARRRNEIGIRLALGANPRNIVVLVGREMLLIIAVGVAAGVACAAAFARTLSSMLFDLPTIDIQTLLTASAIAALIGIAACSVPSIRATRIGVIDALRHD
jgi:predicted permease